jgi:hypothetical protein
MPAEVEQRANAMCQPPAAKNPGLNPLVPTTEGGREIPPIKVSNIPIAESPGRQGLS